MHSPLHWTRKMQLSINHCLVEPNSTDAWLFENKLLAISGDLWVSPAPWEAFSTQYQGIGTGKDKMLHMTVHISLVFGVFDWSILSAALNNIFSSLNILLDRFRFWLIYGYGNANCFWVLLTSACTS